MIKAMLFIDGSWLYANLPELGKEYGKTDFQVDFGKLPTVLAEDIAEQAGIGAIDLVRTYYFASYAENYDARDVAAVQRRMAFFSRLKEDYNYEVEAFPINYQGRRLRRVDRDPGDDFVPKEKCVDISLAITVMHYATVPGAMDVAILLIGDRDFVPLLQDIRRRGIRVALATIYGSCAQELADPADAARVRDFDIIWLNDLLEKVEYVGDDQAARQPGARRVWTTNVPRWGRRPYHWTAHRDELLRTGPDGCAHEGEPGLGEVLHGRIKNIIWDRGFGFIASESGLDYFFHANALEEGLTFEDLQPEMDVVFEVKTRPTALRAGAALTVRRTTGSTETTPAAPPGAADTGNEPALATGAGAAGGDNGVASEEAETGPASSALAEEARAAGLGGALRGRIKNIIWDRGYGFIATESGPDYFFHANGLVELDFESLQPGLAVVFEVRTRPTALRAGAALNVRRDLDAVTDHPAAAPVTAPDARASCARAAASVDADAADAGHEPADEADEPGPRREAAAETLDLSAANAAPERT